jgi:hypothetical protein
MPPAHTRPVRVFSQDESRLGLLPGRRRRLTADGGQPIGVIQPTCEWFDVDGAVAPATGERFFLERPSLHADRLQRFVAAFAQALPDRLHIWLVENRGAPTAPRLRGPEKVRSVWRLPYCPELNPMERRGRDVKDDLAWQPFTDVETQQDHVSQVLHAYEASTRQSLTSDRSLVDAIHALAP